MQKTIGFRPVSIFPQGAGRMLNEFLSVILLLIVVLGLAAWVHEQERSERAVDRAFAAIVSLTKTDGFAEQVARLSKDRELPKRIPLQEVSGIMLKTFKENAELAEPSAINTKALASIKDMFLANKAAHPMSLIEHEYSPTWKTIAVVAKTWKEELRLFRRYPKLMTYFPKPYDVLRDMLRTENAADRRKFLNTFYGMADASDRDVADAEFFLQALCAVFEHDPQNGYELIGNLMGMLGDFLNQVWPEPTSRR